MTMSHSILQIIVNKRKMLAEYLNVLFLDDDLCTRYRKIAKVIDSVEKMEIFIGIIFAHCSSVSVDLRL